MALTLSEMTVKSNAGRARLVTRCEQKAWVVRVGALAERPVQVAAVEAVVVAVVGGK